MRTIDADAIFAVVKGHHDLYKGTTNPADKARRDECLQVMCDINDAPTIEAIPVEWLHLQLKNNPNDIESAYDDICINELIDKWQKEQETR